MRIDSSGNVGIGTTSPGAKFEVSTGGGTEARITSTIDNNADLAFYTNSTKRGVVQGNSVGVTVGTTGSLPTMFISNNTERMRIDSSGNVNIGSSTYSGINERLCVTGQGIVTQSAATTNRALFGTFGGGDLIVGTFDSNNILLRTGNTERLRIDSSGNVGIGTASPDQKLHIVGNYKGVNSSGQGVQIVNAATPYIQSLGTSTINDLMVSSKTFRVETGTSYATSERLRIDSSGNVGIGTTSPSKHLVISNSGAAGMEIGAGNASAAGGTLIEHYNRSSSAYVQARTIASDFLFNAGSNTVAIDSSGRLLVGTTSDVSGSANTKLQAISSGGARIALEEMTLACHLEIRLVTSSFMQTIKAVKIVLDLFVALHRLRIVLQASQQICFLRQPLPVVLRLLSGCESTARVL